MTDKEQEPWPEKVYLLHPSIKTFGAMVSNPERREYVLADRIDELFAENAKNLAASMTQDFIRRDDALALLDSWTYCCDAADAVRALPAVDPVVIHQVDPDAIREAALREAYEVVYKWWFDDGNALPQELILALIGEKK